MLPSKTVPELKNWKCHVLKPKITKVTAATAPPRKKARTTSGTEVEHIESKDNPCARCSGGKAATRSITISPASSFQVSYPVPVKVCKFL